jgi:hypothetical protein
MRHQRKSRGYANRLRRPIESLELRLAPANITVTTVADNTTVDGKVSLREALTSANNNANFNGDVVAVGAYGSDTINFDAALFASPQTITLGSALPSISDNTALQGTTAANVTVARTAGTFRIFDCFATGTGVISFANMSITGGNGTGIDGGGIQVTLSDDHRVFLFHEGYQAKWQIRLPEVVSAREGTFLTSTRPKMKWREYEDGTIGTDWRPDEAYSREAYEKMGRRLKMILGLEISPRIRVGPNRIDLSLRLKNVSDLPFHSVSADGGCLQHRTKRFFDHDLKTSYLLTTAGLTPLSETNRSIGIRGDAHAPRGDARPRPVRDGPLRSVPFLSA